MKILHTYILILMLFVICIILTISTNRQYNRYVIEVEKVKYLKDENFELEKELYEQDFERMKDGQVIKYQDLVIDNLLREEELKYHPNDSLVVKIF